MCHCNVSAGVVCGVPPCLWVKPEYILSRPKSVDFGEIHTDNTQVKSHDVDTQTSGGHKEPREQRKGGENLIALPAARPEDIFAAGGSRETAPTAAAGPPGRLDFRRNPAPRPAAGPELDLVASHQARLQSLRTRACEIVAKKCALSRSKNKEQKLSGSIAGHASRHCAEPTHS